MDYIAELIRLCANKRNCTPRSFNNLLKWINDNENRTNGVLGEDLKVLIISVDWFVDFREIRDNLIHYGSQSIVFGKPVEGTLFQIHGRNFWDKIKPYTDIIRHNENDVLYFDRYAAIYFSFLINLLNDVSEILAKNLEINLKKDEIYKTRCYSFGFNEIFKWMANCVNLLSN